MKKSFIRAWAEGLDQSVPSLNIPDMPAPDAKSKSKGDAPSGETNHGSILGNLGSKIIGTLVEWTQPESGFLHRVKNADVLRDGVNKLWVLTQEFNRMANRLSAQSVIESKGLRDLQSPYLLTASARLQAMLGGDKEVAKKALSQLSLLAPKLEEKWNVFLDDNTLGIRVTNPEVITDPSGVPEEPQIPMGGAEELNPIVPDDVIGGQDELGLVVPDDDVAVPADQIVGGPPPSPAGGPA